MGKRQKKVVVEQKDENVCLDGGEHVLSKLPPTLRVDRTLFNFCVKCFKNITVNK